jgi:hypothetical protein
MNIASMAQQSFVGATQQSATLAAVSPQSFKVASSNAAPKASSASSASASGSASKATLSSQTLQALMDLLQGDPASSATKHPAHHGIGQPPITASNTSSNTASAAADSGTQGDDSSESATLATALGA